MWLIVLAVKFCLVIVVYGCLDRFVGLLGLVIVYNAWFAAVGEFGFVFDFLVCASLSSVWVVGVWCLVVVRFVGRFGAFWVFVVCGLRVYMVCWIVLWLRWFGFPVIWMWVLMRFLAVLVGLWLIFCFLLIWVWDVVVAVSVLVLVF